MKISTLSAVHESETTDVKDSLKKTIYIIFFICIAVIAIADTVQLFAEANSVKVISHGYVNR